MSNPTNIDLNAPLTFEKFAAAWKPAIEATLDQILPAADLQPARLHEAMRYATLGGGKRMRALLVLAAGRVAGAANEQLLAPAAAVELLHAYSLVHDDLPSMDDDALRRGRPTCHKAFDEATALLVGDALQTLAFEVLLADQGNGLSPVQRARMGAVLARASGSLGMAGGQAIDLQAVGRRLDATALETMHRLKTGALIRASVALGALAAAEWDEALLARLDEYAACVGLAFQIQDDILDIEGTAESLGKDSGADQALNKPTFPSIHGLDAAKRMAEDYRGRARECLHGLPLNRCQPLLSLADFAVQRSS